MLRLAVVVPTYNEVNNIQKLLDAIAETVKASADVDTTVFVVDDSSPDGTADLVAQRAPGWEAEHFHVVPLVKPTKNGLGAAYIWAFEQLLPQGFDYFLQMDADLSHDPKYIAGFIHQAKLGTDLVVASRYIPGGGTPDWGVDRRFLSRGGNIYTRLMLSRRISDYTGGFNMFSAALLKRVDVRTIKATGYGFIIVLKYRALREARSLTELPIVFLDRTHGSSKIPRNTLMANFFLVLRMRLGRDR